jgi:hypothetical protein
MLLFEDFSSISLGLIPGSCCVKSYFQTSESVIPECFYRESCAREGVTLAR